VGELRYVKGFQEALDFLQTNEIYSLTQEDELGYLYDQVFSHCLRYVHVKIYDLGTCHGASAIIMAKALSDFRKAYPDRYINPTMQIYTVDTGTQFESFNSDKIKRDFQTFYEQHGIKIEFILDDDFNVIDKETDGSITFIFHDSLHTYEHLSKMIELSLVKCSNHAFICGHDYCGNDVGVMRAVDEFRARHTLKEIVGAGNLRTIWWSIKL
jgi:hypothetical protein